MDSLGVDVKVYIYDLSRGLVRSMSQMFLGKQIDGIWHTGIVVFGQEYYWGSGGIECCPPGGTLLGQPNEIKHLGKTQIPYDMFMDYLADLSRTSFAPFGQMIKPFLDTMSVQPTGGHTVFTANNVQSSSPPTPTADQSNIKSTSKSVTGQSPSAPPPHATSNTGQPTSSATAIEPTVYMEEIPNISVWNKPENQLSERVQSLIHEIYEYLSTKDDSWSLGPNHVKAVSNLALDSAHVCCTCAKQLLVRLALLEEVVGLIISPRVSLIPDCIAKFSQIPEQHQTNILKIFTNVCSSKQGHGFLTNQIHQKPLTTLVVNIVLSESASENSKIALALCNNLTLHTLSEDMELELGSALFSCVDRQHDEPTAFCLVSALSRLTARNQEVRGLARVLDVNLSKLSSSSDRVRQLCCQISSVL
ncbi:uncharacterized protein LOC127866139 isoform X2 [Dreissena polymorpha]|uniref:uncharacterized protein LOC127866139 isoform X2 n=1 Tax=Dreissena polymorpha TaxID=45954 RepID=UPI00226506CB|nr:uncharacterized protein LOC127866139 isoform X2 [Dreissena polymorpha]